jgi:hypothetical protein
MAPKLLCLGLITYLHETNLSLPRASHGANLAHPQEAGILKIVNLFAADPLNNECSFKTEGLGTLVINRYAFMIAPVTVLSHHGAYQVVRVPIPPGAF